MTREVAIGLLSGLMFKGKLKEALDMAIKALEQEPTTKKDLGVDCTNGDMVKKLFPNYTYVGTCVLDKNENILLRDVNYNWWTAPYEGSVPLESEVPSGKWIYDGHHLRCSNCNDYHTIKDSDWNSIASNYCPNCGAKMEQGENT